MPHLGEHVGELCALLTAVSWAVSGIAFGVAARAVGGFALNHFRIWLALPLLALLALAVEGRLWPPGADAERAGLLFVSGLVGLVLGDLGYFHALATVGPRLASVLMATWPVMALGFGLLLGEPFRLAVLPGVFATVLGVVLVLAGGRRGASWNPTGSPRDRLSGVLGALLAAVGQAGGIVLARLAMRGGIAAGGSEGAVVVVDPLGATLLRMTAGVIGLQLAAMLRRRPFAGLAVARQPAALRGAVLGTLLGPVSGVWLSMVATQQSRDIGVAAALMATAPLFLVPLARFFYGTGFGLVGWCGTLLTVAGAVWLLTA